MLVNQVNTQSVLTNITVEQTCTGDLGLSQRVPSQRVHSLTNRVHLPTRDGRSPSSGAGQSKPSFYYKRAAGVRS